MNNSDAKKITIVINSAINKNEKGHFLTKHIFDSSGNSYKDPFYEEYPFFTNFMKIPKEELRRRTFPDKIKFFFNRRTFLDTLNKYQENSINDEIINNTNRDDNSKYNLESMIELLFTTVFPVINDHISSFDTYILQRTSFNISMDGSVPKILNQFFPYLNVDFSYIKLDGQQYTVTSTCILNDILNHPKYSDLIYKVIKFNKWKINANKDIENRILKIIRQIHIHIDDNFSKISQLVNEIERHSIRRSYNEKVVSTEKAQHLNILFDTFRKKQNFSEELVLILKEIKSKIERGSFVELKNLIDEFLIIDVIRRNYFTSNKRDVVSKDTERYFTKNFPEYSAILDEIKKFTYPNCLTNNHKLQSMINDYYSNKNTVFEKFMVYVFDKYLNDDKPIVAFPNELNIYGFEDSTVVDSLHTGINYYESDKQNMYEAQVSFNLIQGKLSYDDLPNISCDYKDEQLGEMVHKKQYETQNLFLKPKPQISKVEDMLKKDSNSKGKKGGSRYRRVRNGKSRRKKNKTLKRRK